jgi:hypothetical protein
MTLEIEVGEDSNSEHPHDSRDTQKLTLQKTTRARCRTTIAALWFWSGSSYPSLPPGHSGYGPARTMLTTVPYSVSG